MKVYLYNQEPLEVTNDEAKQIIDAITNDAKYVVIRGEYIASGAISAVRNDSSESLPKSQWGALPAGRMKNFFDDRRDAHGEGYKKFQEMKAKILNKKKNTPIT